MLNLNHKKLDVWKKSISLVSMIYQLTEKYPKSEVYGLTSQLRKAAISIPSNIAEGASRSSPKERKRFYEVARSSLVEIDTQIEVSKKLRCINISDNSFIVNLEDNMIGLFSMLSKLIERTF